MVDVVPSDDIGSPCSHGRADSEGETLVKRLSEQGQHLVALGAVREVGHPCGTRIPNSWVRVFSLRGREAEWLESSWLSQRPGYQQGSFWPTFLSVYPNSLIAFQGKDGFGAWAGSLFLDMILTVNPSGLNSRANGLSEVMEITFQITQQKCSKKIYLLPFPPPLLKILRLLPLPHVSISVSSFHSLGPSVNQLYMTLSSRKTFTFNCHQAFTVS